VGQECPSFELTFPNPWLMYMVSHTMRLFLPCSLSLEPQWHSGVEAYNITACQWAQSCLCALVSQVVVQVFSGPGAPTDEDPLACHPPG